MRSFQLDRGIFESDLAELAVERGITVTSRATVRRVEEDTAAGGWRVDYRLDDGEARLGCRWVIDASSRASILKRQFGLALDSPHKVNAAWFRIDGAIDIDGMSSRSAWHERISGMPRRMSTNHFMGPGYWIWFIPLPETVSIGLVAPLRLQLLRPGEDLHHPTEILATLAAARSIHSGRIVVVFQPHRYSRTEALFDDFVTAFYQADHLAVMDIYAAGEKPIDGISAEKLADGISGHGHKSCCYTGDIEVTVEHLQAVLLPGDIVITLGAGNVWQVGEELHRLLSASN